jgi:hypothetical protein
MIFFPTLCVDNFYDNPDSVREFALSLDYDNEHNGSGLWSGVQTKPIHLTHPDFFASVSERFFSLYYDFGTSGEVEWNLEIRFNKVYPYDPNPLDFKNQGWVHSDHNALLAGIVYLNDCPTYDSGTALYDIKDNVDYLTTIKQIEKEQHELFKCADGKLPDTFDSKLYHQSLNTNNDMFIETARFSNKYNRLISYDGRQYHAATSTVIPNEPFRLTQLIFVKNLKAPLAPLDRIKRVPVIL